MVAWGTDTCRMESVVSDLEIKMILPGLITAFLFVVLSFTALA